MTGSVRIELRDHEKPLDTPWIVADLQQREASASTRYGSACHRELVVVSRPPLVTSSASFADSIV